MKEAELELEDTIIRALDHGERREILRIISLNERGVSYTDLMGQLGMETGKLNDQLKQLEGLIEKNQERRYVLTPLGNKALSVLGMIEQGFDSEIEKYLKAARSAQTGPLQSLTKSLFLGLIAVLLVVFVAYSYMAYVLLTEGGPPIIIILLPILMVLTIGFLAWLIRALREAPEIIGRLERRIT